MVRVGAREAALAVGLVLAGWLSAACAGRTPPPPTPDPAGVNLDAATIQLINASDRVVFVVPFSHWDTDWHEGFAAYVQRSDGNIRAAMSLAQRDSRFRYTLEQVYFVQHFWETFPELRADLLAAVQRRQITFAWAGIIQPETSLAAPAIQARNWQLGRDWIAATFGEAYVPHTAWQSDAFGNSAALPAFLTKAGIPDLFIGRSQFRCNPADPNCTPLPAAFYWKSPANGARVLAAYLSYPTAWDAIHRLPTQAEQLAALRRVVDDQFKRTTSKYLFLPMGSDFIDPMTELPGLVDAWNAGASASAPRTALVMADPETAFHYLAAEPLPEFTVDLNPIWQGFYATRPFAKIADKESEFYLTAGDKFGWATGAAQSAAWLTATVSAHYDNIGAVSFDAVWEASQRPRFEQTLATAAHDLADTLARIAAGVPAPLVVFNSASWPRSEVIELPLAAIPASLAASAQRLDREHAAVYAQDIPAVGYRSLTPPITLPVQPAVVTQTAGAVTLANGLVSVTLDPARGGTFSNLSTAGGSNLLAGPADDVVDWQDTGDVYGAHFGDALARTSETPAQMTILAAGPWLARVQAAWRLEGRPVTKTVTVRAGSPLVEVTLDIQAAPETSAVLDVPTALKAAIRTDDLGFLAFNHAVDGRPIAPGDVTYRRALFYPVMAWSDVSAEGAGLTLITHGLQGVGGLGTLQVLLVRSVTDKDGEGVTDLDVHTLHYAYRPHIGAVGEANQLAYAFNQPLSAAWRGGVDTITVQIPFRGTPEIFTDLPTAPSRPASLSLISAQAGLVADIDRSGAQARAWLLADNPSVPVTVTLGTSQFSVEAQASAWVTLPPGK